MNIIRKMKENSCSTSPPGGNQVDGLPPAPSIWYVVGGSEAPLGQLPETAMQCCPKASCGMVGA